MDHQRLEIVKICALSIRKKAENWNIKQGNHKIIIRWKKMKCRKKRLAFE